MCYMSSNKVNFAFQMTQEYLMILLSMNDVNSIIGVLIISKPSKPVVYFLSGIIKSKPQFFKKKWIYKE